LYIYFSINSNLALMKPTRTALTQYYQLLGKLFYCVASIDTTVRKEEINTLKILLRKLWIPLEDSTNEFGDDAAYQIEIVFDWMLKNNEKEEDVLFELGQFKRIHPSLFTKSKNSILIYTLEEIANSFARKNKSEHFLIHKIKSIIN
jgi:hypothetical protein